MKIKIIILIIYVFFINVSVNAETLKAGIVYSVNEARIEAFTDIPTKIDIQKYSSHFVDPNYDKNIKAIKKNKNEFKDRYVGHFSSGRYGVRYTNNDDIAYYYNRDGSLIAIVININDTYPLKSVEYNTQGNIETVTLSIVPDEQFIFNLNKKLIAHWIGKNCYDENGHLIMTRN